MEGPHARDHASYLCLARGKHDFKESELMVHVVKVMLVTED
jgi:hypothetical protein